MEVLDDYKFRFGELMNRMKTLGVLFDNFKDKVVEKEIEDTVAKIFEKHGVDVEKIIRAEDKYPHITKVYDAFNEKFSLYRDTARLQKVEEMYNKIREGLDNYVKEYPDPKDDPIKNAQLNVNREEYDDYLGDHYTEFTGSVMSNLVDAADGEGDITENNHASDLFIAYLADSKHEAYVNRHPENIWEL